MLILLNGVQVEEKEANLGLNRAMRYGDGVFETILVKKGELVFWDEHMERMINGLKWMQIEFENNFVHQLRSEVLNLIQVNQINWAGVLKVFAYRRGGGKYEPESNGLEYVVQVTELDSSLTQNETGLRVDLAQENYIHSSQVSGYKTLNALPYVRASIEKSKRGLDELILLNEHGRIVEACSSNIFLLIGGVWYTPSLEEGCLAGVMRKKIIEHFELEGIAFHEGTISHGALLKADEVFLVNSILGLRWVKSYRTKRFFHNRIKLIQNHFKFL